MHPLIRGRHPISLIGARMILNRIELSFDQSKIRQSRILQREWASKRNRSETSLIAIGSRA
jgi:hypothetical protein